MSAEATAAIAVYATFPDFATAQSIGRKIVEAELAACINILPGMHSVYRWKGVIEEAEEVVGIFKSQAGRADAIVAAIEELHPYETPAIVVLPITGGSEAYLRWIGAETGGWF